MRNDLDCNSFLVLMETHYIQKKKRKEKESGKSLSSFLLLFNSLFSILF